MSNIDELTFSVNRSVWRDQTYMWDHLAHIEFDILYNFVAKLLR